MPLLHQRAADLVAGACAFVLPAFHLVAVLVPEVGGQGGIAGVEQVGVFQHLVGVVVLGMDADDGGLDPQVDVLRHQGHRPARMRGLHRQRGDQDRVVRLVAGQDAGQRGLGRLGLEEQLAGGGSAVTAATVAALLQRRGRQRDAFFDLRVVLARHQIVEQAADLAGGTRDFAGAFLQTIEFLQYHHRDEQVVLLETEQAARIVHQHVGVKDEDLLLGHAGSVRGADRVGKDSGGNTQARKKPATRSVPAFGKTDGGANRPKGLRAPAPRPAPLRRGPWP